MGQIAAIRADIAIAPLARFLLQDDMVALDERDGLPKLGTYDIGPLPSAQGATQPVQAVADYVRCVLATAPCSTASRRRPEAASRAR